MIVIGLTGYLSIAEFQVINDSRRIGLNWKIVKYAVAFMVLAFVCGMVCRLLGYRDTGPESLPD